MKLHYRGTADCCIPGHNQGTSSKQPFQYMSKNHRPGYIIHFYLMKWLQWKNPRHFSSQIKVADNIEYNVA